MAKETKKTEKKVEPEVEKLVMHPKGLDNLKDKPKEIPLEKVARNLENKAGDVLKDTPVPKEEPKPPKEVEKPKKEEKLVLEDHEFLQHVKEVSKKAYKEIREHIARLDHREIWEKNKGDIRAEIIANANMGRNEAFIMGVLVPLGETVIPLRTHDAYKGIMTTLNNMGFVANERSRPGEGLFISITW